MEKKVSGKWGVVRGLGVVLILGACIWLGASTQAGETRKRSSDEPAAAPSSEGGVQTVKIDPRLERKLDQILENQQKILQRFDEVMEELKIVKIRATLR